MKKILTILVIAICIIPINVLAASGTIKVTSSTSTGVVGSNITYTVTLASSEKIGSWEMTLNYDSSYLSLQSTTAENNTKMGDSSSSGTTSKTYTYTFKILKSGSSTVSVSNYDIYAFTDMSKMSITPTGKTVTFKTQAEIEASYSTDNTLSGLSVEGYELDNVFVSTTDEYTVSVPEGTKTINISATKNNSYASVSGTGEQEVQSGVNVFELVVTAQNGSVKTYKITVNVIDENPILLAFSSKEFSVVKVAEYLNKPEYFEESTILIDDILIPCFINESLGYTLIGLKDSSGEIALYIYEENSDNYMIYNEISSNNIIVLYKETTDKLENYITSTIIINGQELEVFKVSVESRFSVFSGINVANGEEGLYIYDEVNETIMLYDNEYIEVLESNLVEYRNIILYFAGALSFTFLLLIVVLLKKNKKNTKKKKEVFNIEKEEEPLIESRILDIEEDEEENKVIKKDKKKNKKNKSKKDDSLDF